MGIGRCPNQGASVAQEAESPSSNDAHHSRHVEKGQFQPPVFIGIEVYKRRESHKEKADLIDFELSKRAGPSPHPATCSGPSLNLESRLEKLKELYP